MCKKRIMNKETKKHDNEYSQIRGQVGRWKIIPSSI